MSNQGFFDVELSFNWKTVAEALQHSVAPMMDEEMLLLTTETAKEMQLTARDMLDKLVYEAPLPPSADTTWGGPDRYLQRSRTGRTKNAIKWRIESSVGAREIAASAFVDSRDYPAWFYALALEYGMADRFPSYYPRPFWRLSKIAIREKYLTHGSEVARRVTTRIKGRFV